MSKPTPEDTQREILKQLRTIDRRIRKAQERIDELQAQRETLWRQGKAKGIVLNRMAEASGLAATFITRTLKARG